MASKKIRIRLFSVFGILVSILVACSGEAPTTPIPALTPVVATATQSLAELTPTLFTPSATQTSIFPSSPTLDSAQQVWRSTEIAIATIEKAAYVQGRDAKETQMAQFSVACDELNVYASQVSPDGNWFAASCGYKRDQTLIVKNRQGATWIMKYKDLMVREHSGTVFPESWSPDGNYLYFSTSIGYSGGGNQCFPKPAYSPTNYDVSYGLFRLNLNNGLWVTLISPTDLFPGYNIKFSPTGRRYAVDMNGITVFDLQSGASVKIDAPGFMDFIWSPDGKRLAYTTAHCDQSGWAQSASVYVWSSETNQVRHLFTITIEKMILYPESWLDSNTFRILGDKLVEEASGGYNSTYEVYIFDVSKQERIFSGTATPHP
ncbi:MAG: hypothetical protein ACOYZ6_00355 [Chloroflexota bacterium]